MFYNAGNLHRQPKAKKKPVVVMRPIGGGQFVKTLQYPHSSNSIFPLPTRIQQVTYVDATYDLLSYKHVTQYLDATYTLNAYAVSTQYVDSTYDLLALKPVITYLDATYDKLGYQSVSSYLDASYDVLAYTPVTKTLDVSYDIQAYLANVAYLDATYDLQANERFYTWMINLTTGAVSKADNYSFNSLSGSMGADSTGIHSLTGTTDNGVAINGFVESGRLDFGVTERKRMIDAYVGVEGGSLNLTVTDERTGDNTYKLAATTQLKTAKANLGRGAVGRYWKVKLANVAGSSAKVDDIEVNVEKLTRKV